MKNRESASFLPQEVESELDRLLHRWAECHRLTPAQARAVRQAVVESSSEVGHEWLRGFLSRVGKGVTRSVSSSLQQIAIGWPMGTFKDAPGYQPYLRLA